MLAECGNPPLPWRERTAWPQARPGEGVKRRRCSTDFRFSQPVNETAVFDHKLLQNKKLFAFPPGGSIPSVRDGRIGVFLAGFCHGWVVSFTV